MPTERRTRRSRRRMSHILDIHDDVPRFAGSIVNVPGNKNESDHGPRISHPSSGGEVSLAHRRLSAAGGCEARAVREMPLPIDPWLDIATFGATLGRPPSALASRIGTSETRYCGHRERGMGRSVVLGECRICLAEDAPYRATRLVIWAVGLPASPTTTACAAVC